MRKNEVGVDHKGLQCQNCGEAYGWSEYFDYMTTLRSTTIDCFTCPEENYVVPGPFLKILPLRLICMAIPLLIAGGFIYGLADVAMTDTGYRYSIPKFSIAFGLFLGGVAYLVLIKTMHWFTGTLTMDRNFKSDTDYDIY